MIKYISIFLITFIFLFVSCSQGTKQEKVVVEKIYCDPNNSKVIEDLEFVDTFTEEIMTTSFGDFSIVSLDEINTKIGSKTTLEYRFYDGVLGETPIWEVCGKIVIFFEPVNWRDKGLVYYNGNLYYSLKETIPDYHISNKISFSQESKNIKDKENDESISEKYINNSKYSIEIVGYNQGSFPITVLKKDGVIVSDKKYKYIGVPNAWDGSYTDYKNHPTYIVANKEQYNWKDGTSSPLYNKDVKYKIVSNGKDLSKEYDAISNLVTINGKLGYRYKKNEKIYLIYDNKVLGKKFKSVGNIIDTGKDSFAYIGKDNDRVFHIIKDNKEIFSFTTDRYRSIGIHSSSMGSVALTGEKFSVNIRDENMEGFGYIQYGDNKIEGIQGKLKFINNKLIIYAVPDRKIYIEK